MIKKDTWQPLSSVTQRIVEQLERKRREDSFVDFLLKRCEEDRPNG